MKYTTKRMVMGKDLNPSNTLFGGRALEWIDEEAAIYAYEELQYPTNIVTKCMTSINFLSPAKLGDVIEMGMDTVRVGTTSITVSCVMRNKNTKKEILKVEEIVFVNIGPDGRPLAHNIQPAEIEAWMLPTPPIQTV